MWVTFFTIHSRGSERVPSFRSVAVGRPVCRVSILWVVYRFFCGGGDDTQGRPRRRGRCSYHRSASRLLGKNERENWSHSLARSLARSLPLPPSVFVGRPRPARTHERQGIINHDVLGSSTLPPSLLLFLSLTLIAIRPTKRTDGRRATDRREEARHPIPSAIPHFRQSQAATALHLHLQRASLSPRLFSSLLSPSFYPSSALPPNSHSHSQSPTQGPHGRRPRPPSPILRCTDADARNREREMRRAGVEVQNARRERKDTCAKCDERMKIGA